MWSAWEKPGLGHLRLAVRESGVVADGLVLGEAEGRPFRLAYDVTSPGRSLGLRRGAKTGSPRRSQTGRGRRTPRFSRDGRWYLRVPVGDRGHGVAGTREGPSQRALPATHLQHPGRRVTDLAEDELLDALLPPRGLTHETSRPAVPVDRFVREGDSHVPGPGGIVVPLRIRHEGAELSFFSTAATFGTPLDVTVAELVIESSFPANPETASVLRQHG